MARAEPDARAVSVLSSRANRRGNIRANGQAAAERQQPTARRPSSLRPCARSKPKAAASTRWRPRCATASGRSLHRGDRPDPRRARPRDRHRHGQVRPCRAQDRLHFRLHRHAGAVRASGRSQPRRPRHDRQQRRHHRAVLVGRDGGAEEPHRLFAPLPHRPDRDDRQCRIRRWPRPPTWCWRCRRRARPARTIWRRPPPR